MKKSRILWLLIPAACILGVLFWDTLLMALAPKLLLSSAITRAAEQLQERFRDHPAALVMEHLSPEGTYAGTVAFEKNEPLLGSVSYDLRFQARTGALTAQGSLSAADREVDLKIYADREFLAVSSEGLLEGNYYGTRYDSFARDLKSIPLIGMLLRDSKVSQWEGKLLSLQGKLERLRLPKCPDLSRIPWKTLVPLILAAPCERWETALVMGDTALQCQRLDYSLEGENAGKLLTQVIGHSFGSDTAVRVSCYLYEKALVKVGIQVAAGEELRQFSLTLGRDPAKDPLELGLYEQVAGAIRECTVRMQSSRGESQLRESWKITSAGQERTVSFTWDPAAGKLTLCPGIREQEAAVQLRSREGGLTLETEDLGKALAALGLAEGEGSHFPCSMTIGPGSGVNTPEYKPLPQWSMQDFLTLINGLGSLVGIGLN